MGSPIKINDTLKISKERGFPDLVIGEDNSEFLDREFDFWNAGTRLYNVPPSNVLLVQEMEDGKWLYWGHAHIIEQTITPEKTSGKFKIIKLYDSEYQRMVTKNEAPEGKSYEF